MNLDDMGGESNVGGANQIFYFLPYFSDIDFLLLFSFILWPLLLTE